MAVALVTGGSRGLGQALAAALSERGFDLVLDGRDARALENSAKTLQGTGRVVSIAGDITDPEHRRQLGEAAVRLGGLDLLINNASELGPAPPPRIEALDPDELRAILETNVVAPIELVRASLAMLRASSGCVIAISSDAGTESYEGWAGYGSSKAALDLAHRVLGIEEPALSVYVLDPGEMRTDMYRAAFPGAGDADATDPRVVADRLLALYDKRPPSGRYVLAELVGR